MEQLETLYDKIYNKKTKSYFREVLISYQNESYRSAVVMLYSVVISDILYKLSDMDTIYEDENAKSILNYIREEQKDKPNSPEWEKKIIEEVNKKTKLIDSSLLANINHLKNQRNLSAHPIIDSNDYLLSPTREDIIAHMRNMLEGLFTKPPIFTREIEMHFIIDLAEKKEYLINDSDLEKYIVNNYIKYFNDYIIRNIFSKLWKFTFKLVNEETTENRDMNIRTLQILFNEKKSLLLTYLNEQYYQENISFDNEVVFHRFIQFIAKNKIYEYLNDNTKKLLKAKIENDENLSFISYFLKNNIVEHLKSIEEEVNNPLSKPFEYNNVKKEYTESMYNICQYEGHTEKFLDLSLLIFSKSNNFDNANHNFDSYIEPFILKFSEYQLKQIINIFDENGQIRGRNRGKYDLTLVFNEIDKRNITIDLNIYPNLNEILG